VALDRSIYPQLMVAGAGVMWSTGAPLIRFLEEATEWQFLFYRNVAMVVALLLILKLRQPGRSVVSKLRDGIWANMLGGFFLAIGFVAFLFSINYTTVATTLFMMSASPFLAALAAYLFLNEILSARQWIAIFGGCIGILIMIGEGISTSSFFGAFMGLVTALGFAGFSIVLRWGKSHEMLQTVCFAGIFTAAVSCVMALATGQGLGLIPTDWLIAIIYGVFGMAAGILPPSQLLKKFASYPRQHELALALREIGRIERTLFIIEWLLDADMQRRAQIGLNKGEAHHALKNALRVGRQGEIRDRTAEGQHYRIAGLNLLVAIIIYWNTKHLGQAVAARKRAGLDCSPRLLSHISPLGWAHILLTGEYRWKNQSRKPL